MTKEDPRAEEVQNANATIFRNMALANPVAAAVRSAALRGISHMRPIVRRMTEKEALVRQRLYVPDGEVPHEVPSASRESEDLDGR